MYASRLFLIIVTLLNIIGLTFSDCPWKICDQAFYATFHESLDPCAEIKQAMNCLEAADCSGTIDLSLYSFQFQLNNHHLEYNCSENTLTDAPTSPPPTNSTNPTFVECDPQLLPLPANSDAVQVVELSQPSVYPSDSLSNVLCSQHYYPTLRQCSLFSYSHLRSFGASEIQTCSLPGAWYLLKHPDVTIEVTSVADNAKSSFTKLEKVNITLQDSKCTLDATINYVATATDDELPSTFSSDDYIKVKILDPIDFHVNEDHTIATIHAPWLNLTIVVTKHDDYLGVVLRMPADLIRGADGLCSSSCPSHAALGGIDSVKEGSCYHDANSAVYACADLSPILTAPVGSDIHVISNSFHDICQFDVLQSLSYNVLSFLTAIAVQYSLLPNLLPDVTPDPFDFIFPPIHPAATSTSSSSSTSSSLEDPPTATNNAVSMAGQVTSSSSHDVSVTPPTNNPPPAEFLPSSSSMVTVDRMVMLWLLLLPIFLLYRC